MVSCKSSIVDRSSEIRCSFNDSITLSEKKLSKPISLQNFLEEQKEPNKNTSDATELMKKTFPNIKKSSEMGKTGVFGETSGSFGNSSGTSTNSSNTETLSSGSGSGSSGGIYSSSSNNK